MWTVRIWVLTQLAEKQQSHSKAIYWINKTKSERAREQESENVGENKRLYADVQEAPCVQPWGLISQIRHLNPRHFRAAVLSLAAY